MHLPESLNYIPRIHGKVGREKQLYKAFVHMKAMMTPVWLLSDLHEKVLQEVLAPLALQPLSPK